MFTHIMVPVDLAEKGNVTKAVAVAANQARRYVARITLVSVMGGLRGKVSHYVEKYA